MVRLVVDSSRNRAGGTMVSRAVFFLDFPVLDGFEIAYLTLQIFWPPIKQSKYVN
jgi:hypothetical protein